MTELEDQANKHTQPFIFEGQADRNPSTVFVDLEKQEKLDKKKKRGFNPLGRSSVDSITEGPNMLQKSETYGFGYFADSKEAKEAEEKQIKKKKTRNLALSDIREI